jgi:hypothetical protein
MSMSCFCICICICITQRGCSALAHAATNGLAIRYTLVVYIVYVYIVCIVSFEIQIFDSIFDELYHNIVLTYVYHMNSHDSVCELLLRSGADPNIASGTVCIHPVCIFICMY